MKINKTSVFKCSFFVSSTFLVYSIIKEEMSKKIRLPLENNIHLPQEFFHNNPNKSWMTGQKNIKTQLFRSRNMDKLLWPKLDEIEEHDRITNQLSKEYQPKIKEEKMIVLINGPNNAETRLHNEYCHVQSCKVSYDTSIANLEKAHAVIHFNSFNHLNYCRPTSQIWILFLLESPKNSYVVDASYDQINWTATYRRDSVLVTPYEKFVHFSNFSKLPPEKVEFNYARGKTKKVAWFVSNCHAQNGRYEYAKELQKYIEVDIFGACGTKRCSRTKSVDCFTMLKQDYKFYLAFENSNCKDYITEKLYWNAFRNDIVPIVMGARPEDYTAVAPPNSFIHVDHFKSPKHLADYLKVLDTNDEMYNSFFRWKGTGEFINTKFWCRLCTMLHSADNGEGFAMSYNNFQQWWKGGDICIEKGGELWASWGKRGNVDKIISQSVTKVTYEPSSLKCVQNRRNRHLSLKLWIFLSLSIALLLFLCVIYINYRCSY